MSALRPSNLGLFGVPFSSEYAGEKMKKRLTNICEDFEFRAVQRCDNLVDLEKRCKMSIWTQKSALIQLRTSLLKFDDLAEKSELSSVSNFLT